MNSNTSWEDDLRTIPVDERIVLLQYNTHLFEGSMAVGVAGIEKKRITFDDEIRRNAIKERIKEVNADLVSLNEVWSESYMKWFANELKDLYPYHAFGPEKSSLCISSGLVLLSKFKILNLIKYIYDRERGNLGGTKLPLRPKEFFDFPWNIWSKLSRIPEDNYANKGVLSAVIEGPGGKVFVISITHTAGPEDIGQLISKTREKINDPKAAGCAAIITGDLNIHKAKRLDLNSKMKELKAEDAWAELKGSEEGYTVDCPQNNLDQYFSPDKVPNPKDEGQVDRLDYVFYTPPGKPEEQPSLEPVSAHVIRNWKFPGKTYCRDLFRDKWQSNYVAIRSYNDSKGRPYLFGLKGTDEAYIHRIKDNGGGFLHPISWEETHNGKWQSRYVGSAVRTFQLKGRPYVFALKNDGYAYITELKDDGTWGKDTAKESWQSNYVAIVPFYLGGEPYLFGIKRKGRGYIHRIIKQPDGKTPWEETFQAPWQSNYVPNAITAFELGCQPYIFALKKTNQAYIHRIIKQPDGKTPWEETYHGPWQSNYVAIVSYQLDGRPYLFGLKRTGRAYITPITDDGRWGKDVYDQPWSADYVGTCITPFYLNGDPFLFALKGNNEGWIMKLTKPGEQIDLSDHYPLQVAFRYK